MPGGTAASPEGPVGEAPEGPRGASGKRAVVDSPLSPVLSFRDALILGKAGLGGQFSVSPRVRPSWKLRQSQL